MDHLARAQALLRIPAQRKVASLLEGEYTALHRGRSIEFNDLREYVRGDDPKDLDWKASARARTLLVRRYDALRRLELLLVVPSGRSMSAAATPEVTKRDLAVAVAGLVGQLAVRHGDVVGLVHGDSAGATVVPRRGGAAHVERCLAAVWQAATPDAATTDLAAVLGEVTRSVRTRCFVVVVCDLAEPDPGVADVLRRLRVQHEVLVVLVDGLAATDPEAPESATVHDVDLAVGVPAWLRTDTRLRQDFDDVRSAHRADVEASLDRLRIAHARVSRPEDVLPAVRRLFERHRRVGRR